MFIRCRSPFVSCRSSYRSTWRLWVLGSCMTCRQKSCDRSYQHIQRKKFFLLPRVYQGKGGKSLWRTFNVCDEGKGEWLVYRSRPTHSFDLFIPEIRPVGIPGIAVPKTLTLLSLSIPFRWQSETVVLESSTDLHILKGVSSSYLTPTRKTSYGTVHETPD